jgi:hypothetical protein
MRWLKRLLSKLDDLYLEMRRRQAERVLGDMRATIESMRPDDPEA